MEGSRYEQRCRLQGSLLDYYSEGRMLGNILAPIRYIKHYNCGLRELPTSLIDTQTEWSKWIKQSTAPRKTDILQYWKAKQFEFPVVAEIARAHLAIPGTSAPAECVFSTGSDIVTKKRIRLSPETIRYMLELDE